MPTGLELARAKVLAALPGVGADRDDPVSVFELDSPDLSDCA
jgi:hypothetical protein